jgi:glycosyltransferase involved in cell wall biosynthesis
MREMINAFRLLGHEVIPLIAGGTEKKGKKSKSNLFSLLKNNFKRSIPSIIWESFRDYSLLLFDRGLRDVLRKVIREIKPDLIYERGNYLQISGVEMAKELGVKHYLEINAPYVEERISFSGKSLLKRRAEIIERKQFLLSDKAFVVSSILKGYFVQKCKIDPQKIYVIPNAIDNHTIKINSVFEGVIRKKYGLSKQIVIGFVGSFFPYHGVDVLINAFSKIVSRYNDIHLLIIGDGEILDLLKKNAQDLGVENKITFTGNVDHADIYNYINIMDIAVMAKSNWYGSPVKIFEYGALGKAIIAPNVVPLRDVMVNKVDGILVNSTVYELERAIKTLIYDVELREKIGRTFQKKVLHEHNWEYMAKKILTQ